MKPTRKIRTRPSSETLKEMLHYNPRRGELTWRINRGRTAKAGDDAGTVRRTDGQIVVTLRGRQYLAQRLIWLYMTGQEPAEPLTFVDRNPLNLKWTNIEPRSNYLSQTKAAIYQRRNRKARRDRERLAEERERAVAIGHLAYDAKGHLHGTD